jgi:hypothetical protein
VGVLWRVLAGLVVDVSEPREAAAAVDLTLALLWLVVGVVVGAVVVLYPGPRPASRFVGALIGLLAGGAFSWGVGLLFGITHLRAVGAAFVAAPVTALIVFLTTLLEYLRRPRQPERLDDPVETG